MTFSALYSKEARIILSWTMYRIHRLFTIYFQIFNEKETEAGDKIACFIQNISKRKIHIVQLCTRQEQDWGNPFSVGVCAFVKVVNTFVSFISSIDTGGEYFIIVVKMFSLASGFCLSTDIKKRKNNRDIPFRMNMFDA